MLLPSVWIALFAGLSGSVLVLVKPYYAVMVLAPALLVVIRRRNLRPLLAPEYWTIGIVCVTYLLVVLLFHPEFIDTVYPVVADTYVQVRFRPTVLSGYAVPYASVMALVWLLSKRRNDSELATVAILASAAGLICLVYQGKGFTYHAYPALLSAVAALLCVGAKSMTEAAVPSLRLSVPLVPLLLVGGNLARLRPFRFTTLPDATLVHDGGGLDR